MMTSKRERLRNVEASCLAEIHLHLEKKRRSGQSKLSVFASVREK